MSNRHAVLCWLDCEMTGLDPKDCVIVQMAIILTNEELEELAPPLVLNIWQPESCLEKMCPYVRMMHEKSGLLREIRASTMSIWEAEQEAMKLLTQYAHYRTAKLCGNSITQDRRFLWEYMPGFESYLHYRQIDVSTLKELYFWWNRKKFHKSNEQQHTALFDVRQSIAELKYYREYAWRLPV